MLQPVNKTWQCYYSINVRVRINGQYCNLGSIYQRPRAIYLGQLFYIQRLVNHSFYQRPQAIYLRSIGLYFQRRQSSASRGQRFNTTGSSFSVTRHSTNTDNSNSTIMLFAIIYYYHNVIPLLNCMRVHAQGFAVSIKFNTLSYSILRRTDDSTSSTSCVADDIRSG